MNDSYKISGQYLKAKVESIEKSLEETGHKMDQVLEKVSLIEPRVLKLEFKSGIWGCIGGALVILGQILSKKVLQ